MTNKILILGAGFVAGPLIEYLSRNPTNRLTVVSHILSEAQKLAELSEQVVAMTGDVTNNDEMDNCIAQHDLVISLVPYVFHVPIAKLCIKNKKNMITASYVSAEMKALNEAASKAGILILNEIGLDPGIDHLSAMKIIDEAHAENGRIVSFASWCGGLPAPECNDNPLGYKFAWAPRAVLLALLNEARYLKNGHDKVIPAADLLGEVKPVQVCDEFELEGYPNRDSSPYREAYNIPEVKNLIRGTLRYQGFGEIFEVIKQLGLLDLNTAVQDGQTWADWLLQAKNRLSEQPSKRVDQALSWLGLDSSQSMAKAQSLLDSFCQLLQTKLNYKPNEFDMVVLQHKFEIEFPASRQFLTSTLVVKGEAGGFSAMAKTVGYPAAIAAQLTLDGQFDQTGVHIPVQRGFYSPILEKLEAEGIHCVENIESSLDEAFFL